MLCLISLSRLPRNCIFNDFQHRALSPAKWFKEETENKKEKALNKTAFPLLHQRKKQVGVINNDNLSALRDLCFFRAECVTKLYLKLI